jgi:hypothetical protein
VARAETLILGLLADGQPHPIDQLKALTLPYDIIDAALINLINEEAVINDDGFLQIQ